MMLYPSSFLLTDKDVQELQKPRPIFRRAAIAQPCQNASSLKPLVYTCLIQCYKCGAVLSSFRNENVDDKDFTITAPQPQTNDFALLQDLKLAPQTALQISLELLEADCRAKVKMNTRKDKVLKCHTCSTKIGFARPSTEHCVLLRDRVIINEQVEQVSQTEDSIRDTAAAT